MVAAAVIGAGALAAGATVYSSGQASKAQQGAASSANAEAQREYDQTRTDQAPYRTAGYSALDRISDLLGLSGNTSAPGYGSYGKPISVSDVENEPGYQFGLTQGLKTQQGSAAARGGLYSGAELKALTQYGNDYATTKYDDAFNRELTNQNTVLNRLSGVSGTGQTATNQVDSQGQQLGQTIGNNLIGAGNARGAADIAAGTAFGNAANQVGGWWLRQPGTTPGPQIGNYTNDGNGYGGYGSTMYGDGYGPG